MKQLPLKRTKGFVIVRPPCSDKWVFIHRISAGIGNQNCFPCLECLFKACLFLSQSSTGFIAGAYYPLFLSLWRCLVRVIAPAWGHGWAPHWGSWGCIGLHIQGRVLCQSGCQCRWAHRCCCDCLWGHMHSLYIYIYINTFLRTIDSLFFGFYVGLIGSGW